MRLYHVYILANLSRQLYIGVTNDLPRRLAQHRSGQWPGFTREFRIAMLVHFESTPNVRGAISREKQLKRWPRERKVRLIERHNLGWLDLGSSLSPHRSEASCG
jgi:putative endonuclease